MPRVDTKYLHHASQRSVANREGQKDDKLLIVFKLCKLRVSRRNTGALNYDTHEVIREKDMWVTFSDFKHQLSPSNPNRNIEDYEKQISRCLTTLSVPADEHRAVIQKVFRVVEAAETTQLPVLVVIWEANRRVGPYTRPTVGGGRVGAKVTPAATSAIAGLKSLVDVDGSVFRQTPSCAICLEDFDVVDQQKVPMTELPCRHRFHVHCIVQCLEISHLCPLCRYAMPTQED